MSSLLIAATQPVTDPAASIGPIDLKTALLITLVVVTVVLIAVTRKLTRLHRRIEVLETTAPFSAEPTSKNGVIPPETVAAISAAVHTTLRGRLRILSVGEINAQRQAWSLEGRRQVFHSHKVR